MKFKSEVQLEALNNATVDTDKFLVSDSSTVKYRTGSQLLSDLGVSGIYVPYTGATGNVDLGTHTLSSYNLIVNHTSGSGVAASITKGGSGEALTINKTSGSGNAMSVTGGLTSLVDLTLSSIANSTIDTDRFIVSDSGLIKYRTGAQVLLDIGGQAALTNPITGTGTLNYVSKFTGTTSLGNSQIFDNGTNVGIGTTSPGAKLDVISTVRTTNNDTDSFKASNFQMHVYDGTSVSYGGGMFQTNSASSYQQISANQTNIYAFRSGGMRLATGNAPIIFGTGNSDLDFSTERMRITSSGNVGIGTSSPNAKLQVADPSNFFVASFTGNSSNSLSLGTFGTTPSVQGFTTVGTNADISLQPNGGNVGIGTTNPLRKLEVASDGSNWISGTFSGTGNTDKVVIGNLNGATIGSHNSALNAWSDFTVGGTDIKFSPYGSEAMRVAANGNVGIGTTSPAGKLSILDGYYNTFFSDTSSQYGSGLILSGDGGGNQRSWRQFVKNGTGGVVMSFEVSTNGTSYGSSPTGLTYSEKMRIDGNGNVGIGTTSPTSKLHIVNNITNYTPTLTLTNTANSNGALSGIRMISNNGSNGLYIGIHSTGSLNEDAFILQERNAALSLATNNTERMRITSGGNVGIGTTSPSYTLHVNGSVAGTSAYVNLSDKRHKKDILPIENALDKILALNGVTFNWDKESTDMNLDDNNHIGLIAQDVEQIIPQAVVTSKDENETKSVAYTDLVPVLIEAIKELKAEIEILKNK